MAENTPTFMNKVEAVIFDMDGVLIDSGAFHRAAWRALLDESGVPVSDPEFWRSTIGRPVEEALPLLFNRPLSRRELACYSQRKTELYHSFARQGFAPVPGAQAFVRALADARIPQGVASSASRQSVHAVLKRLNLHESFRAVVTADDVKNGKPDPEVFLMAAYRLKVSPVHCLVFEDSEVGIRSATSAGMACIGLTTSHTDLELREAGAFRTVPDFKGVRWEEITLP